MSQMQSDQNSAPLDDASMRLAAGEELKLEEAMAAYSVRPKELWKLGGMLGCGRVGSPLSPRSEWSGNAWLHLRWEIDSFSFDCVLVTPEGIRVYDVVVKAVGASPDEGQSLSSKAEEAPDVADLAAASVAQARSSGEPRPEEPSAVFARIAADRSDAGSHWTSAEYVSELSKAKISFSTESKRVHGVRMGDRGTIETGCNGAPLLLGLLLATRYRIQRTKFSDHATFPTWRSIGRDLGRWVEKEHPDLVRGGRFSADNDRNIDALCGNLRKLFSDRPTAEVTAENAKSISRKTPPKTFR